MVDALVNKGLVKVNQENSVSSGRVVIVGTARGGTSMIAGALDKLGVFMGDKSYPPVYEDIVLSELFESEKYESVSEVAARYSTKYPVWGWKRPSSISYLNRVHDFLDSPKYIFIFKDVLSIANRNSISMLSDLIETMDKTIYEYQSALDFLKKNKPCAMLVSYDKALRNPEYLVDSLCDFLGLKVAKKQLDEAVSFISPDPIDYLDSTRITKSIGFIDQMEDGVVRGWAKLVHSNKPAKVNLYKGDFLIGSSLANKYRKDLAEKFSTDCAFEFNLEDFGVHATSGLRVRVENEIADLKVSGKSA